MSVYINGLQLEEPTKDLAKENLEDGAEIVELGTETIPESEYIYDFSFPKEDGNPTHTSGPTRRSPGATPRSSRTTCRHDPANADYYAANYDKFSRVVDGLDEAMGASRSPRSRKHELLTYHDAYAYFAKTYDWDVIGAIQVLDFEDPTPAEVADLIDQVKAEGVPAIFGSEVFPSPVLEQIGKEAGVTYVDELRDDDLPGEPGDEHPPGWASCGSTSSP